MKEAAPAEVVVQLSEKDKQMVAVLVAVGEPAEQTAGKLGLDRKVVEEYLKSPEGSEQVIRIQTALYPDPGQRLKRLAHLAIDTNVRLLLRGKSEAVVAKVAADVLDRSQGKAVQVHENRNLNVNVTDLAAADRALKAQEERLKKLEEVALKLKAAHSK